MPQLHLYVSKELADQVKERAKSDKRTVSQYLADLVKKEVADEWPPDFFERLVGGWEGERLERPPQLPYETRVELRLPETRQRSESPQED